MRVSIQNNFPQMRGRLERFKLAARTTYREQMTGAIERADRNVRRMTPRSTGRMASGWRHKVIGGSAKGRVAVAGWVSNRFAEEDRFNYRRRRTHVDFSDLSSREIGQRQETVPTDGKVVLAVLEYGSRPHLIRPLSETGLLTFRGERGWVSTRLVTHPGTRAHGMIRRARVQLAMDIRLINRAVCREARRIVLGR